MSSQLRTESACRCEYQQFQKRVQIFQNPSLPRTGRDFLSPAQDLDFIRNFLKSSLWSSWSMGK